MPVQWTKGKIGKMKIDYAIKQEALKHFNSAVEPLQNITFQCAVTVGCTWLLVQANEEWYIELSLDVMDNTMKVRKYCKTTERSREYFMNLRRPVIQELKKKMQTIAKRRNLFKI